MLLEESPFDSDFILEDVIKTKLLRKTILGLEVGDCKKIDYKFHGKNIKLNLGNVRSKLCRISKEENIKVRTKIKNNYLWIQRIS